MKTLKISFQKHQKGLTLIESLVALVVLALGVLGLAGVQTRALVETRTTNSRAIAIGLIDDLSNRMLLNRDVAIGTQVNPNNAIEIPSAYTIAAWTSAPPPATTSAPDPTDCKANSIVCTPTQLAQYDVMAWRRAVAAAFPGGQVRVVNSTNDFRQIGIAIAWPENERKLANTTDQTAADKPFVIDNNNSGMTCPTATASAPAFICHFVYVQP